MSDVTVEEIIEIKLAKKVAENPQLTRDIEGVYQFIITGKGGGQWVLEFGKNSFKLRRGKCENADCIFTASDKNLIGIITGTINPALAFLTGRIKFTNLSYATKLKPLFTN